MSQFHAVNPKSDCPHCDNFISGTVPTIRFPSPCSACSDTTENWLCLNCHSIGCSRYVKSHQKAHFDSTGHCIAASYSDLSVWCYVCESYIKDNKLQPILSAMSKAKFGSSQETEESASSTDGEWNPKSSKNEEASSSSPAEEEEEEVELSVDLIKQLFGFTLSSETKPQETALKGDVTIEAVAKGIKNGTFKNIIVMTGAGISVAAGIPDFRTPGTGLYDNLQKYGLPYPTAVFELDYFKQRPEPFYTLAKELYPGNFNPTIVHYFIKLLHQKKVLLRNFTQNIDTLERVAGVDGEMLVEAHGSFAEAHCIQCKKAEDIEEVKKAVFSDTIPKCKECGGLVKPDIVFFGESLPPRFFSKVSEDFPKCDLLLVIGTSLQVQPFASLIGKVGPEVPRVLINREAVATMDNKFAMFGFSGSNYFSFGQSNNYRDIACLGDCQDKTMELVDLCGWKADLEKMMKSSKL